MIGIAAIMRDATARFEELRAFRRISFPVMGQVDNPIPNPVIGSGRVVFCSPSPNFDHFLTEDTEKT
jgi:hypothetical protein